jgi:3-dehydroquinate synthase
MKTFSINETEFEVDEHFKKSFNINSHPEKYMVSFNSFENKFEPSDVVLVDANVCKLYEINHDKIISIHALEENKSIDIVLDICNKLLSMNFNKGNRLVVIGGGILQDIGAFVSKIFKRGIDWIFYPTTLLSQCDSCIGGKTALNFNSHKNQLALFSAPKEVIIDINFLKTLSQKDIISGYGEIIKLFLIGGQYYVDMIDNFDKEELIYHSLSIKKSIIEMDEFEKSERKSLNYGHSFGHVIEPMTQYEIPHGEAVLIGIEIINKLFDDNKNISELINKFTSIDRIKNLNVIDIVNRLRTDKKSTNNHITLIRVIEPGKTIFTETEINTSLMEKVNAIFVN